MSLEMTHDDVRAALAAEALGALEPGEHQAVTEHVTSCAECRAELAAYREAGDALAYAAPPATMDPARSAEIRSRLLERAAADRAERASGRAGEARAAPPSTGPDHSTRVVPIDRGRPRQVSGWLAIAASLVLLVVAGSYAFTLRGRVDQLRRELALAEGKARESAEELRRQEQVIAALSGPSVRVIDLASTQQRAPTGRMFWDPTTDRWTFFAHHLPQVRAGREYQLWLITPTGPVGAGTFTPVAGGAARLEATFDLPPDQLRAVAVTEEPAGGVPQPTGQILILGQVSAE
jgi:anti-sigma-K factor RskA